MDEKGLVKRVEGAVLKGGLQPPSQKNCRKNGRKGKKRFEPFLNILFMKAYWLRLKVKYISSIPLRETERGIGELLEGASRDHTSQFKEMTKASRKYVIPLIEYLIRSN